MYFFEYIVIIKLVNTYNYLGDIIIMKTVKYCFTSKKLLGYMILLFVVFETAFENTQLQIYNLNMNRTLFSIEASIFLVYIFISKYKKYLFIVVMSFFILFLSSYFVLDTSALFKMYMIAMVVYEIGYKEVFEKIFKIRAFILCSIVFLSIIGVLDSNLMEVYKKTSSVAVYGYGLGYTHPNRLATAVLYLIFIYICLKNEKLKKQNVYCMIFLTFIVYELTKSRTLLYCIIIFCLYYGLHRINKLKNTVEKCVSRLAFLCIPISILISVFVPILLLTAKGKVQNMVYFINDLCSRRFTHIEHAFLQYPVTLQGGIYDFSEMEKNYGSTVIDNGYIRFLYAYGIIGLTIFSILSIVCMVRMTKKRKFTYVVICIIASFQALLENTFMYVSLNIMVLFWCEIIDVNNKNHWRKNDT